MKKIFLLLFPLSIYAQEGIQFKSLSWDEALSESRTSNKLIFLDAYTTWCGPCKALEKYTFTDSNVGALFNASFINVRFDMEQYPGLELAEKYKVDLYPNLLFINGKGELVHRGCGAMEADELIELGQQALNPEESLSFLENKFNNSNRSEALIEKYVNALDNACLGLDGFLENYFLGIPNDSLITKKNWFVFSRYDFDIYGNRFQFLLNNQDSFESKIERVEVQDKIYDTFMSQYLDLSDAEGYALFGIKGLLYMVNQYEFDRKNELIGFLNFGLGELSEDWSLYANGAISFIDPAFEDPELVMDVAWKFYLFIEDKEMLLRALNWTKYVLENEEPHPSVIDTYASLLFKLGRKEDAIKFEEQAVQLAESWGENTEHFDHQLRKFKK